MLITPPARTSRRRASPSSRSCKGTIRAAKGHLGAFELTVDDYAAPRRPRAANCISAPARDGAVSRCDILLDLSGGAPLFPAADLRDGYLRADPGDPAAVLRAVLKARDLIGTLRQAALHRLHRRSLRAFALQDRRLPPLPRSLPDRRDRARRRSCRDRCAYLRRLRAMRRRLPDRRRRLRAAAGRRADAQAAHAAHGLSRGRRRSARSCCCTTASTAAALIDALARHGDGLPANVLPLAVNEVTQVGLEAIAAAFAYGAAAVRFLLRAKPRHDVAGLRQHDRAGRADPRRPRLWPARASPPSRPTIRTRSARPCARSRRCDGAPQPATFAPVGEQARRDAACAARTARASRRRRSTSIALPAGAPFGTVEVNVEGCTLCLSCVSACPTGALSDDPERPMLRFAEDACVQCGLCKATCPEKVITLTPQIDFRAATADARACSSRKSRSTASAAASRSA